MTEITLTGQFGGSDAFDLLNPYIVKLRTLFKLFSDKTYSEDVESFDLKLFVSGEITEFEEKSGIGRIRFMKKRKTISGEIIINKEIWTLEDKPLRDYLAKIIRELFGLFVGKITKAKITIESEKLLKDIDEIVLKTFSEMKIK